MGKYKVDYVQSPHSDPKKLQFGMKKSVVLSMPDGKVQAQWVDRAIRQRVPSTQHFRIISITPVNANTKVSKTNSKNTKNDPNAMSEMGCFMVIVGFIFALILLSRLFDVVKSLFV